MVTKDQLCRVFQVTELNVVWRVFRGSENLVYGSAAGTDASQRDRIQSAITTINGNKPRIFETVRRLFVRLTNARILTERRTFDRLL